MSSCPSLTIRSPAHQQDKTTTLHETLPRPLNPRLALLPPASPSPPPATPLHSAASHVAQHICSHLTSLPSIIITQLHLPPSFQLLPHQQQFHRLFRASYGHVASGHLGTDTALMCGGGGCGIVLAIVLAHVCLCVAPERPLRYDLEREGDGAEEQ